MSTGQTELLDLMFCFKMSDPLPAVDISKHLLLPWRMSTLLLEIWPSREDTGLSAYSAAGFNPEEPLFSCMASLSDTEYPNICSMTCGG